MDGSKNVKVLFHVRQGHEFHAKADGGEEEEERLGRQTGNASLAGMVGR